MEIISSHDINEHNIATVFHDSGSKKIVIFCHGYRSSSIGPNRFFVKAARHLENEGVSSLCFDQFGSGNSEGDFINSSFLDWIETTKEIVSKYLNQGYKIALWGQSMGGSTVLKVASVIPEISAVVSWVPDASVDKFIPNSTGWEEEEGQRVQSSFWSEAHGIDFANCLGRIKIPTYVVQCTKDEFVNEVNRKAISSAAQPNHIIDIFEGYRHSKWTFNQAEKIIDRSVKFIIKNT
jgi:esterase/lipase